MDVLELPYFYFYLLLSCCFPNSEGQNKDQDLVEYVYGYRVINWCVVGKTEPALFEWPLVQLKPFLLKTQGLGKYEDFNEIPEQVVGTSSPDEITTTPPTFPPEPPPPTYTMEFKRITCTEEDNIGNVKGADKSTFHNRVHIQLKIQDTNNPNYGGIEGLLIQANHAPYGLGFPFGQFDHGDDVQCDCKFLHAKTIPCISRPDTEILAPTVAAFHYQLPGYITSNSATKDRIFPKITQEIGKQKEFHFHFKWHHTPCSPASTVEFWVLIVHDFFRRKYEIKKFGPYSSFNSLSDNYLGAAPNMHNSADDNNELKWPASPISGPKPPMIRYIQQPLFMPSPLFPKCREALISAPHCNPFDASDVMADPTKKIKECHEEYFVQCHGTPDFFKKPALVEDTKKGHIRLNGEFDTKCIQKYEFGRAYRQCPQWTGKMRCYGNYIDLKNVDKLKERRVGGPEDPFFPESLCLPCDYEPTTEYVEIKEPGKPFFKRTLHGALMILAFFYILPLSIVIGRFYKETFHDVELKGWKLWLWIHVGISIFFMLVCYGAYNLPTFFELDTHMYWGYGALFSGGFGIISGWGRQKSWRGLRYMLGVHALTGYLTWFCAGMSLSESKASAAAKGVIMFTHFACGTIMVALTCHVCVVDSKLGVKPSRSHFPVLQVRFEDAFVPGQKFRQRFLYVLCAVLFIIIFVTFCI